jgi:hypothetical protein
MYDCVNHHSRMVRSSHIARVVIGPTRHEDSQSCHGPCLGLKICHAMRADVPRILSTRRHESAGPGRHDTTQVQLYQYHSSGIILTITTFYDFVVIYLYTTIKSTICLKLHKPTTPTVIISPTCTIHNKLTSLDPTNYTISSTSFVSLTPIQRSNIFGSISSLIPQLPPCGGPHTNP